MTSTVVRGTSGALHAALDVALAADLSVLAAPELVCELAELRRARARLDAVQLRVLAAVEGRRRDGDFGSTSTAQVLASVDPLTAKQARAVVQLAEAVTSRCTLTGESLPALAPLTGAALVEGTVTADHAMVVVQTLESLPDWADHETAAVVESTMAQACAHLHVPALKRMAALLLARLDQDGPEPDDGERARAGRGLSSRAWRDGLTRWTLDLPPADNELFRAVIDALSAPAPATADPAPSTSDVSGTPGDGLSNAGGPGAGVTGAMDVPDPRSAAQRRCDGLVEACSRLISSGSLPSTGGAAVTVLVTMTLEQLQQRRGVAVTDRGTPWPVPQLLDAAADYLPLITEPNGAPLFLGRTVRLATPAQRRALAVRDGGCVFPSCDRPPSWCEAHHVHEWADGGPTDINNLALLCRQHHREHARQGWHLTMRDGRPHWTPPRWLRPVSNLADGADHQLPVTRRHRPEINFRVPARTPRSVSPHRVGPRGRAPNPPPPRPPLRT